MPVHCWRLPLRSTVSPGQPARRTSLIESFILGVDHTTLGPGTMVLAGHGGKDGNIAKGTGHLSVICGPVGLGAILKQRDTMLTGQRGDMWDVGWFAADVGHDNGTGAGVRSVPRSAAGRCYNCPQPSQRS